MKKVNISIDIINVILRKVITENPTYSIIITSPTKHTYKDLTFERMAEYIKTQPNSEARLVEFEAVKTVAEAKGRKYPLTKHWFLETYPEYKLNEVSQDETKTIIKKKSENTTSVITAKAS